MQQLFTFLTHSVEGSPAIAMTAAVLWGVLSILLSPCHLASIPLIVGFIDQQGRMTLRRAFTISLLFSLGILITIGVIGAITAAAGRMMGDIGSWGNYGILLLVLYGVGHCGVIVLAGMFTGAVQRYLNWNEKSKGATILKKVCGVLVLLGGFYLIYTAR